MKDLNLASKIIEATVKATDLNVSVKFRKGWDNNSANAVDFAKMCEESGVSYITVHGRTRAQGYSGLADWNIIKEVKNSVKIPVIGNGDITSPEKAKEMIDLTGVDGVMIARGTLGNPWILGQTHDYLTIGTYSKINSVFEIRDALLQQLNDMVDFYGKEMAVAISRKYVCWYSKNLRDAKKFREIYTKIYDYDVAIQTINDYFSKQGELAE